MIKENTKHWSTRLGALAIVLTFGTGCAEYQVRKLHNMTPTGSEFTKVLAEEYKSFSTNEIREHRDTIDARHFAMKGQKASAGEEVMPEPLDLIHWELPASALPELQEARARLISALNCHGRTKAPMQAAKAQVNFDRWVEQLEERWQMNHIMMARLAFYEYLRQVEEIICPLKGAPEFNVYFPLGSDKVTKKGHKTLDEAVASAKDNCHCKVFLTGRTDAVASRNYNLDLSNRRAESVKAALSEKGIEGDRLVPRGFGEVPKSPQYHWPNRRVNILIH